VALGLRFPEQIVENEFQNYFCNRMYGIAQFAMLLAFIAYVVYGVSDFDCLGSRHRSASRLETRQ
jgi:hypothetical protein